MVTITKNPDVRAGSSRGRIDDWTVTVHRVAGHVGDFTASMQPCARRLEHAVLARTVRVSRDALIVWLVWATMLALQIAFVANYAAHVPFWDDLEVLRNWVSQPERSLASLWMLHNEHRIPLPLALQVGLLFLTRDFRSGMYFEIAIFAAVAAAMVLAVRRVRGRSVWTDAFFPLLWMHTGNAENLLMGFQISLAIPTALASALLLVATANPRNIGVKTAIGCSLAVFALPLCGGVGITQVPVYLAGLFALGFAILRGRVGGSRAAAWTLLGGSAATIALVAFYFVGFRYSPDGVMTTDPRKIATVALSFLSMAFGQSGREWWPWSITIVLALSSAAAVLCIARWKRDPSERVRAGGLLIAMCGIVLLAVGIGHGRGGAPSAGVVGFAVRYIGLPAPLLCAAYLAATAYGSALVSSVVRVACVSWMCAAIPLVEIPHGLDYGENRRHLESEVQSAVTSGMSPASVFAELGNRTYPTQAGFCYLFRLLAENRLAPFDRAPEEIRHEWTGRALETHPTSIESPDGKKPYIDALGDGNEGLIVPPDSALHFALSGGEEHVSCAFGMTPRRYIYGPVGGLCVLVTLEIDGDCPRTLFEKDLDPMRSEDDRSAQDLDVEIPEHGQGDLCLRMLPLDRAINSGWGYWTRLTVE